MKQTRPHPRVQTSVADDGRTEQNHIDDTNINIIMARAQRGITPTYIKDSPGAYGDASGLTFLEAQTVVADAKTMFEELPSKIRNRFDNKPEDFLDFIQDPKNKPEAIELGLIKKTPPKVEPEPLSVKIISDESIATTVPPETK